MVYNNSQLQDNSFEDDEYDTNNLGNYNYFGYEYNFDEEYAMEKEKRKLRQQQKKAKKPKKSNNTTFPTPSPSPSSSSSSCETASKLSEQSKKQIDDTQFKTENKINHRKNESEKFAPKKKLTTADQIYHRILWDPTLTPDDFTIGYLDRFTGIEEIPFTSFIPLNSEFETNNSIPFHRIQYFACLGLKVWDKIERLNRFEDDMQSILQIYNHSPEYDEDIDKDENVVSCK